MGLRLVLRLLAVMYMKIDVPADEHIRDLEHLGEFGSHQRVVLADTQQLLLHRHDVPFDELFVVVDIFSLDARTELVFGGGQAAIFPFALAFYED